jgi:predicted PhzF superfamily epimerase YddE/YHI9
MRLFQIDSFTDRLFAGNPAGVVLLDEPRDAAWMQAVAAEMNLAETAFLQSREEAGCYDLRWFTPMVEVDLCGHATLASAHALWQSGEESERLRFVTRSGELTADRSGEGIRLDFPVDAPYALADAGLAGAVAAALGVQARWIGRNSDKYLVEVADETTVRSVRPEFSQVGALDAMGVIVTARADRDGPADFVSRFFAPAVGIDEDPVTGAAHCCLAPFWSAQLGRDELLGYQASARGGFVGVAVIGDRVLLTGRAVTVFRAELA